MKTKILFFLYLSLFSFTLFGQHKPHQKIIIENETFFFFDYQDTNFINTPLQNYRKHPIDGNWIRLFKQDTSKIAGIFSVKNGMQNGVSTTYWFNGKIQEEVNLSNNQLKGAWKSWYQNGQLEHISNYILKDYGNTTLDLTDGLSKQWYSNGKLKQFTNFVEGSKEGNAYKYFENGGIKKQGRYAENQLDGKNISFHPNGKIYEEINYVNGKIPDNVIIRYHPNGTIAEKGRIRNNSKTGLWHYYNLNGSLISKGKWGTMPMRSSGGAILISLQTTDWEYYHKNGLVKARGNYNTNIELVDSKYLNSIEDLEQRDEKWKYYDDKGKEISKLLFEKLGYELIHKINYDD